MVGLTAGEAASQFENDVKKETCMMRKTVVVLIALMLLGALVPGNINAAAPKAAAPFPMTKGTYWVYSGPTKWTPVDATEAKEQVMTWKMEITDTFQREGIGLAVVKGHPSDLAFYEDGRTPGDYVIVNVNDQKYYLLSGDRAQSALKQIKDTEDALVDLVQDTELWLDLPLTPGKSFGETAQIARPDRMYTWLVDKEEPAQLKGIKGVTATAKMTATDLSLTTLPEKETVQFVLGLGITQFSYVHNGTEASTDLKLIEYHAGS
jgi:hypothetical protein